MKHNPKQVPSSLSCQASVPFPAAVPARSVPFPTLGPVVEREPSYISRGGGRYGL